MHTPLSPVDHREARRLTWKSRHIPFATIFAGGWAVAAVLSTVLSILAQTPINPMP